MTSQPPPGSSKPAYSIRLATPSDAEAISTLVYTTWAKFFAWSVTPSDLETYRTTLLAPESIRREIEDEGKRFYVAVLPPDSDRTTEPVSAGNGSTANGHEDLPNGDSVPETTTPSGEEIIAVAQLNLHTTESNLLTPNPIELNRLYVHPSHHGLGLAPTLLAHVEGVAREWGRGGIWLGAWENNSRAIRFYEKMGFREREEHFFWVGESKRRDVVLEKAL